VTEPGRPGACPRCGTAYAAGQEYCLECGLRLPADAGLFGGLSAAWARRGWYPGDWIWPVLVFGVLAALGALAAILLSTGTSGGGTLVATPPIATQPPTTVATSTLVTTAPPPTTTTTPPKPPPTKTLISWPAQNGYTIVLESIPTSAGRSGALSVAKRALAAGLPQVGVLDSARFASLHPGYYVAFSGVYASNAEASAHLAQATAAGFARAYVRPITH
jgi:hypothetical protein